MSTKSSVLHSWKQFKKLYDEDQEYAEAERAGLRADEQPKPRKKTHNLKVEEYSINGKWRPDEQRGACIRLKGAWLAQIFKPNTRVSVEVSNGTITIKEK